MSRRRRSDGRDDGRQSAKRRRYFDEEDAEDRLESLIMHVFDKGMSTVEADLDELASILEADLVNRRTKILDLLCQTPTCLPDRMTVYTTLVGLLNAKSYNFGASVVEKLVEHLRKSLEEQQFKSARHLFHFLADLVNSNVITPASVTQLMESFSSVLSEIESPQVRTDWYAYTVMSAIPWVAEVLIDKRKPEFERILDKLENYVRRRKKDHVAGLRVWSSDEDSTEEDYLDSLWTQIQSMQKDSWNSHFIRKPYRSFNNVLREALQQSLPLIQPPPHEESTVYPVPKLVFRLFEDKDIVEDLVLPSHTSIEWFVLNESIHNVIDVWHKDRRECARVLVSIPGKSKLPLNYILVECVFGDLFRFPSPHHLPVMYGCLLLELCRLNPSTMPVVLVQAVSLLFERMDHMNTVCINRFATWFSFHLSNVQFRWDWEDWQIHLELPADHPKRKFISEVLDMCIRLSYHERISELLPDSFSSVLPPRPKANVKYNKEVKADLPGSDVAQRFLTSVRSKASLDQLKSVLSELADEPPTTTPSEGCIMPVSLRLEVFLQTICNVGSKSFSHMFLALTKFKSLFLELMASENAQLEGLAILTEIWETNSQMLTVLVDKMHRIKIVSKLSLVKWIFHPGMSKFFIRRFPWDILDSTLRKTIDQSLQMSEELKQMEKSVVEKSGNDKMESDLVEERKMMLTDDLDRAEAEQKETFLVVLQHFVMVLTEHLLQYEKDGKDSATLWFLCTRDQLRQTLCQYADVIVKYREALESLLFTPETDKRILAVYHDFQGLIS